LFVWLPILSDQVLGGGVELYGLLLGALAVGEVISSILAGTLVLPFSLGIAICLGQVLSGVALSLMGFSATIPVAIISLALLGFFSAPLTIWAQTLRMKIIPHHLRGRTFALLRTMMQSANPIGGALGGALMPLLSIPVMIVISALCIGLPGLIGYSVSALREAA
jgi:MFS family permease